MSRFDVDGTMRWFRPYNQKTLSRRSDDDLPFIGGSLEAGPQLLLDTCVYIDQLQGKTPAVLDDVFTSRPINHSTVAIQELMHTIGVLDPGHSDTNSVVEPILELLSDIPNHRIKTPDLDIISKASLLSGSLCRSQGYMKDDKKKAFNDCVIFLQARKLGFLLVSRNVKDFDFLLQLIPDTHVLLYR